MYKFTFKKDITSQKTAIAKIFCLQRPFLQHILASFPEACQAQPLMKTYG